MNRELSVLVETVPCPFCEATEFTILFNARDRLHNIPGIFGIAQCTKCKGLFTNPRPRKADIAQYYPDKYCPHQTTGYYSAQNQSIVISLLSDLFHWYMKAFDVIETVKITGQRLLELGCATGLYLDSQRKYKLELHGVEFAEYPAKFAREQRDLNVVWGELQDAQYPTNYFDAVVAWMVLEHIYSPNELLREIYRIMKPNSIFVFSIPNAGSWEFLIFRQYWYALDVPRHLTHFVPQSVQFLLQKNGFNVERIIHQSNVDNVFSSIGYWLNEHIPSIPFSKWLIDFPNNPQKIVRFIIRPLLQPFAILLSILHQSGRITVIARRS